MNTLKKKVQCNAISHERNATKNYSKVITLTRMTVIKTME